MWMLYSLGAAIIWGLVYALAGNLVRTMSNATIIAIFEAFTSVAMLLISLLEGDLSNDWEVLKKGGHELKLLTLISVANVCGMLMVYASFRLKNATSTVMIEVSYPIFVALFSWLLFKENQLSLGLVLGGCLIMTGIACIVYFNRAI